MERNNERVNKIKLIKSNLNHLGVHNCLCDIILDYNTLSGIDGEDENKFIDANCVIDDDNDGINDKDVNGVICNKGDMNSNRKRDRNSNRNSNRNNYTFNDDYKFALSLSNPVDITPNILCICHNTYNTFFEFICFYLDKSENNREHHLLILLSI